MSLEIYQRGKYKGDKEVIHNVEADFVPMLIDDQYTRDCLCRIEGGEYLHEDRFLDRVGLPLYVGLLSTGCKAALLVHYKKDCVIDLVECGFNAISFIIQNNTEGSVILPENGAFVEIYKEAVDARYMGRHYSDASELAESINGGV